MIKSKPSRSVRMKNGWNYRIMRHKDKLPTKMAIALGQKFAIWYGLHEVYYEDDKPHGWTEDSMIGSFETKSELVESLELMLRDAKKKRPVLNFKVTKRKKV